MHFTVQREADECSRVKLAEQYGIDGTGDRFLLPRAERALNAVRNAQIRADYMATRSLRQLAIQHGMTERHASRIVAKAQVGDQRQSTLDL
ncbi:Mor transcription activator family protein [Variovorax sp. M-6]|uniref:Mor transcription activator family protein n=1 Tax=Variovorax sp. M-6 TaxID=3233041 RepID=UPI003F95A6DA